MKKYEDIKVGDREQIIHLITKDDIEKFVSLTGDNNKLHIDEAFAKTTSFGKPVVHGMLGASFISTIIGTKLPGDGALWFSQTIEFLLPVRVGDELTISAEVVKKIDSDRIIELKIEIKNQNRQIVTRGISKVKVIEPQKELIVEGEQTPATSYALVIGGTGGIGRAVCSALAADGFHVFIHYLSNQKLANQLRQEIINKGGNATLVKADITKLEDRVNLYHEFTRYSGNLKVLVNCASMKIPRISFEELEWSDFSAQIDFHVKSVFEISKLFLKELRMAKAAKIINIGTLATDKPNTEWTHYITAKSALHGLTKALAIELGPKGISVNMVSPGLTDTELTSDIPEKVKLITASQTPLRRLALVKDIAGAVSFLASDKADFISGENIRVNGGQVMI